MNISTCYYCGRNLHEGTTIFHEYDQEDYCIIEDVPARICTQCGERYYDSRVLEQIELIVKAKKSADREITVPVFKYVA